MHLCGWKAAVQQPVKTREELEHWSEQPWSTLFPMMFFSVGRHLVAVFLKFERYLVTTGKAESVEVAGEFIHRQTQISDSGALILSLIDPPDRPGFRSDQSQWSVGVCAEAVRTYCNGRRSSSSFHTILVYIFMLSYSHGYIITWKIILTSWRFTSCHAI